MNTDSRRKHLSTKYLLARMVMQENRERIASWVALRLEPYRKAILNMHKERR